MKASPAFSDACGEPGRSSSPANQDLALVGDGDARQTPDEGRLAGAVRADKPVHLAARDIHVDIAQRDFPGEVFA